MYNNRRFKPHNNFRKKTLQKSLPYHELMQAIRSVDFLKSGKIIAEEERESTSNFDLFGISSRVLQNVNNKGYKVPTPIQHQAIPAIMSGRDVIGIANTGTGKTAAFLIPLVDKVFRNKSERVIIVAPTRELAVQIHDELKSFSKGLGIYPALLIGGMSMWRQKRDLRSNPHFVIGTPGRIKDLIGERNLSLSVFHNVVLDEADRMVDIGFVNEIKYFISLLPADRQSFFFSATISGKAREVLNQFGIDPIKALIITAVINGVVAVSLIFLIAKIANNKKIMGEYKSGILSNIIAWLTFAAMGSAVIIMFLTFWKS